METGIFQISNDICGMSEGNFESITPSLYFVPKVLPPDTLLFGVSLNQDANYFPVSNFLKPSGPILLIIEVTLEWSL